MEIVQSNALITINATMVIQLISFLILVFFLHRVMLRPLAGIIQKRKDFLDQLEVDVEQGQTRLLAMEEQLNVKKKEFFTESSLLRKQLVEEANAAGNEIIMTARGKVMEELQQVGRQSQAEAEEIRKQFATLADELSHDIIAKVLDRRAA